MRSLAIAALAALSAIGASATALRRENFVFVDFDMFDEATCDFSGGQQSLGNHHVDLENLKPFHSASNRCRFFGGGSAPTEVGAVNANIVGDACELFVYVDESCSTPPADPRTGGCVFNGRRFRSWRINCDGLTL